jgi:cobalamin synthase
VTGTAGQTSIKAWLPLFGAALGAAGAGIYWLILRSQPASLATFACVVLWAAAGWMPHEGNFPYATVTLAALAKWLALDHFAGPNLLFVCIAAQAVPRAAMVGLVWVSRPAANFTLSSSLRTPAAIAALGQGILAASLVGLRAGVVLIVGSFLIAKLVREYFYKRWGGVNADAMGATQQFLEIFTLTIFACGACAW